MTTDIVESADRQVVTARDDDRIVADVDGEEVARLGNLRLNADKDPMASKDQA